MELYGRDQERAVVDGLLDGARKQRGGVLVVRGEAGIGKTALLDHAAEHATDLRVLRGLGIESESELAFAGLHLLLGAHADRLDALPAPQARALRAAFGLDVDAPGGGTADRFLVGLAVLSLLGEIAEERPLAVLVDDAQWLDQASVEALLFAARRLGSDPVALVFAVRDGHPFPASGLAELRLAGLDEETGARLLHQHADGLPAHVRGLVLQEARGNPLALLELPAALSAAQRSGDLHADFFHLGSRPVSERVERTFLDRARALPPRAQDLLVLAAAEPTGDLAAVLAAGRALDASLDDLAAAEASRLISVADGRLRFTHPLSRSAVYRAAPLSLRTAVHRALAEATTADRRAWHRAAAATGPDESVAADLERTAQAARRRGGHQAEAAAYERAAALSPTDEQRARRLVAAAEAVENAGEQQRAAGLADRAAAHPLDPLTRARLARIRATAANARGDQRAAHALLVEAAAEVGPHDARAAAYMFLDAMSAAWALNDPGMIARTSAGLAALRPTAAGRAGDVAGGAAPDGAAGGGVDGAASDVADGAVWGGAPGDARRGAHAAARGGAPGDARRGAPGEARGDAYGAARLATAVDGLAAVALGDPARGLPAARLLVEAPAAPEAPGEAASASGPAGAPGLWERASTHWWHQLIGDLGAAYERARALERDCRAGDAIGLMPAALFHLARAQLLMGRLRDATASAAEGARIAEDTAQGLFAGNLRGVLAHIAAAEGDEDRCRALTRELSAQGLPIAGAWSGGALALLDLGHGRHDEALHRLEDLWAGPHGHSGFALYALPDLVESAVRVGRPERAEAAAAAFGKWADATGQPWARAVALRCRALLATVGAAAGAVEGAEATGAAGVTGAAGDGGAAARTDPADALFAEAVRVHLHDQRPFERARTELLYGEWLRRRLRRSDARPRLRAALELFDAVGAPLWAERARAELRATGETTPVRDREPGLLDRLTPQELQIVRLAATGLSNRDIAAQLFLSPRTVGYHLYKAYPKLGVASRGELARMDLGE
ncbi:helix-turn-helix transcriptional regulator [Streptomyces sp. AN091965]|uniref:helix-turn-helix transcriptional regulator n=1 Tax=Streptomyces sp. AN091965 TaxID=2927803 RepID=UPI001F60D079|nr:LuxR family transcriptional regulator [Streptomyces sp. AN091965]MCI3929348.1 AAA family ATPase [Streptomyces sp. AN091965]